ncbi:MAG: FMN-binding negative transcriptional regulator [Chloroflexota bacterium]
MYIPPQFKEDRIPALHAAMRQAGLATLVTFGVDGPEASHVPMLLDSEPAPFGTLHGHISKANVQWRQSRPDVQALAIFTGPDAYISPAWYETKRQTGKVVPTWNYVAIHASGPVRFFHDPERLLDQVTRLTEENEDGRPAQWAVSDAPADFINGLLKGIVGFDLTIVRLEGKWKMGQNRPEGDRIGAIDGLTREGGAPELAVAKILAGEAGPWRG